MLALPGGAYVYQGEELALPEVRDIPEDRLTDPRWAMSNHTDRGRDGCRVPLPWKADPAGAFGFSSNAALTPTQAWLPQSPWWGSYAVDTQEGHPDSTLTMYRQALALRHKEVGLGDGPMTWIQTGESVLAFFSPWRFCLLCKLWCTNRSARQCATPSLQWTAGWHNDSDRYCGLVAIGSGIVSQSTRLRTISNFQDFTIS